MAKTYWTRELKPAILKGLKDAGFDPKKDKEFWNDYLLFRKSICSIQSLDIAGYTREYICNSTPWHKAGILLYKLNNQGHNCKEAVHWEKFKAYCEHHGIVPNADFGDWLA